MRRAGERAARNAQRWCGAGYLLLGAFIPIGTALRFPWRNTRLTASIGLLTILERLTRHKSAPTSAFGIPYYSCWWSRSLRRNHFSRPAPAALHRKIRTLSRTVHGGNCLQRVSFLLGFPIALRGRGRLDAVELAAFSVRGAGLRCRMADAAERPGLFIPLLARTS
jgi:hypothetical protein